jgi:hypothetical protein
MAQHDRHHDTHGGAHAHGDAHLPYDEARVESELTADREGMFHGFIRFTAWNVVLIFAILALLALTQT